jgi:hypothetical protein
MLRSGGAVAIFATAYTAMIISLRMLPPGYRTSGEFVVLLLGFLAVAWGVIAPHRTRR